MGFIFDPDRKAEAQERLQAHHERDQAPAGSARVPFAMEPVVYDFAINERGTRAELLAGDAALMPPGYYTLTVPALLRQDPRAAAGLAARRAGPLRRRLPHRARSSPAWCRRSSTACCRARAEAGVAAGETSTRCSSQRLRPRAARADPRRPARRPHRPGAEPPAGEQPHRRRRRRTTCATPRASLPGQRYRELGCEALAAGAVAVVSLAGGAGSRWTKGAGVVKALNPFCRLGGRHRSFLEVHLAKSRRIARAVRHAAAARHHHQLPDARRRSSGCLRGGEQLRLLRARCCCRRAGAIGLRLVPMARDLRFAWEEMPQQLLDEQAQKVRDSLRAALIALGASRRAKAATTPTTCRCSACIRWATGTRCRTCCATACWRGCSTSARSCAT